MLSSVVHRTAHLGTGAPGRSSGSFNERKVEMKSVVVSVLAMMVLAGTALAAIPSTMAYKLATEPLISGRVASVNDHMMIVDTDQGGHVTLAVDTKTMVPTDLGPGMAMRVEFRGM